MIGYSIPVRLWEKDSQPNIEEKVFFESINNIAEICQQHLEDEFGPDMTSTLNAPFYYKQVEYVDKKGKKKTKRDETAAPVLYAKLITLKKPNKFFLFLKQKDSKKLIFFNITAK